MNNKVNDESMDVCYINPDLSNIRNEIYELDLLNGNNVLYNLKRKHLIKDYNKLANAIKDAYLLKYQQCNHEYAKVGQSDYYCMICGLYTKYNKYHYNEFANPKYQAMKEYLDQNTFCINHSIAHFEDENELNLFMLTHVRKKTKPRV